MIRHSWDQNSKKAFSLLSVLLFKIRIYSRTAEAKPSDSDKTLNLMALTPPTHKHNTLFAIIEMIVEIL